MKFLLILFFLSSLSLYSQNDNTALPVDKEIVSKPVREVPPLQNRDKIEATQESAVDAVLTYYNIASTLQGQYLELTQKKEDPINPPSFENLTDADYRMARRYFTLAKKYYNLIDSLNLPNEIRIRDKEWNNKVNALQQAFFDDCRYAYTYMSVSGYATYFVGGGDERNSSPGPAGRFDVNVLKLLGIGQDITLWYDFASPKFKSNPNPDDLSLPELSWDSWIHSTGMTLRLKLPATKSYIHGFALGAGYFWHQGNITNLGSPTFTWHGPKAEIEYFGGIPSCNTPFEVFARVSMLFRGDFNGSYGAFHPYYEALHVGNDVSLNLGIRYNFWHSKGREL